MLQKRWCRGQVIIIQLFYGQAEIDHVQIAWIKPRQDRVGLINLLLNGITNIEDRFPCNPDGDVSLHGQQLDCRVLL